MNDNTQRRLRDARYWLLRAQDDLAMARQSIGADMYRAEREFCKAIDRAWEAQCMAQGSL